MTRCTATSPHKPIVYIDCYVASVSAQVKDKSSTVLLSEITRLVLLGTRIITDALKSYGQLREFGYEHAIIVHKQNFVDVLDDSIHTQNIEIRNRWTKDSSSATAATDVFILTVLPMLTVNDRLQWLLCPANTLLPCHLVAGSNHWRCRSRCFTYMEYSQVGHQLHSLLCSLSAFTVMR